MADNATPHISISQMTTISLCPKARELEKVDGLKLPPSTSMIRGTGLDKSVDANMGNVIEAEEMLGREDVRDSARDAVNDQWSDEGVYFEPEERKLDKKKLKGATVDSAVALAVCHYDVVAPTIKPVAIQRPWAIHLPDIGWDILGYIDIDEGDGIIDTKSSAKSPSKGTADNSFQLTGYAMGKCCVDELDYQADFPVRLDTIVALKGGPAYRVQESTRNATDYRSFIQRAAGVVAQIESGISPPCPPDHWKCSSKYCGYYDDICEYGRRGRSRG